MAHSLSPTIHQMFAEQCDVAISYDKLCPPLEDFAGSLEHFFEDPHAVGCNVTMPFKGEAAKLATRLDHAAQLAGAVNTLHRQNSSMRSEDSRSEVSLNGYNTDGVGLVADLKNQAVALADQRVLLIGAGGAARGVIHPLLNAGLKTLIITNRTMAKAENIASQAGDSRVVALDKPGLAECRPDIIVNTTSASLGGELPDLNNISFTQCQLAYDMVYQAEPTVFMKQALELGAQNAADGLGMLVEQAAAAFTIWTSMQPQTRPVIEALRQQLRR
uniref:shikimate dehydrogenase n=1 Tax=Salinimonas marina TaxID=2785918 RepID=UPI001E55F16C